MYIFGCILFEKELQNEKIRLLWSEQDNKDRICIG